MGVGVRDGGRDPWDLARLWVHGVRTKLTSGHPVHEDYLVFGVGEPCPPPLLALAPGTCKSPHVATCHLTATPHQAQQVYTEGQSTK